MRELPRLKNTVFITTTISTTKSVDDCFLFIIESLPEYYKELSSGHDYFRTVSGNSLSPGEKIECSEKAGNQSIVHNYIVDEVIPNIRVHYSSRPSFVKIKLPWTTIHSKSNTYVWYDFDTDNQGKSFVRLTIGIQFHSWFKKLNAQIFMGIVPWEKHCLEEMKGLKQILESTNSKKLKP